MKQLQTYITFNGNCREAMTFYKDCLGGDLRFLTLEEAPLSDKMPQKMKDYILHATLKIGSWMILASDLVGEEGLLKGNNISLFLDFNSEEEIQNCFQKLSVGGYINQALEENFWGALFGNLTDKFGNHWLLNYNRDQNN